MNNKYYLIGSAFLIAFLIWNFTSFEPRKIEDPINKVESNNHKSEIIEFKKSDLDYSKLPSYAKPEAYKIGKRTCGDFIVIYPGGSMFNDVFKTSEEAQKFINESAKTSLESWENSGGVDY